MIRVRARAVVGNVVLFNLYNTAGANKNRFLCGKCSPLRKEELCGSRYLRGYPTLSRNRTPQEPLCRAVSWIQHSTKIALHRRAAPSVLDNHVEAMKSNTAKGCNVSLRDRFPKQQMENVKKLVAQGVELKKAGRIVAYKVRSIGLAAIPTLEERKDNRRKFG
jgi:hypothetical protein